MSAPSRRGAGALVAALLLAAAPASAAHIDLSASDLGGGSLVEYDLGPGTLAFDPAFVAFSPMQLTVVLEDGDAGAPLAWNALVDNLTGELWASFTLALEGATWDFAGSATANAGAVLAVTGGDLLREIVLAPPGEPAGLDLGAALGVGTDWRIDVGLLGTGDSFVLVLEPLAVPEPASGALLALGLAALAARRRR